MRCIICKAEEKNGFIKHKITCIYPRGYNPEDVGLAIIDEPTIPLLDDADDFYVEDEPVEEVIAAFDKGEKHLTGKKHV